MGESAPLQTIIRGDKTNGNIACPICYTTQVKTENAVENIPCEYPNKDGRNVNKLWTIAVDHVVGRCYHSDEFSLNSDKFR